MMPEEPCDGKSPPRSRGDRPWEKSVSLVPDAASGMYGFDVAAAAAAAAAAACCFLLCSSALWTSAILCASAAAAAWCIAMALCACAACIDDIIDSDSAA